MKSPRKLLSLTPAGPGLRTVDGFIRFWERVAGRKATADERRRIEARIAEIEQAQTGRAAPVTNRRGCV